MLIGGAKNDGLSGASSSVSDAAADKNPILDERRNRILDAMFGEISPCMAVVRPEQLWIDPEIAKECCNEVRVSQTSLEVPRLKSADGYKASDAYEVARFIAGGKEPSDRLVTGMREQLGNLRAAIHWKNKERSLTEIRALSDKVCRAATNLQSFPNNGQLAKSKMASAWADAEILRAFLNDSELLSYILNDGAPIFAASLPTALALILERSHWATLPTNGKPKKLPDINIGEITEFVSELHYIAQLSREAADRKRVKRRMLPVEDRKDSVQKKRDPHKQQFSPSLLCALIIGVAIAEASSPERRLRREVTFPKNSDEACEILWCAAGGEGHDLDTSTCHSFWNEHCRAARSRASRELMLTVSKSFR